MLLLCSAIDAVAIGIVLWSQNYLFEICNLYSAPVPIQIPSNDTTLVPILYTKQLEVFL